MKNTILQFHKLPLCVTLFLLNWVTFVLPAQSQANYTGHFTDTPLEVVLEQWKSEYKLLFAYDHASVTGVYVNQKIQANTLQEALSKLLNDTPLTFRLIESDRILIFKKTEPSTNPPSPYLSLSGRIFDISTKEPLAFANILASSGLGTSTDQNGYFTLSVPSENSVDIQVQYIGYENFKTTISSAHPTNFQIALTPQPYQIQAVTVVEKLPVLSNHLSPQATTLSTALLEKLPHLGVGTDLFRTLQYLPGISAFDDSSAGIRIRGSAEGDNLVILDGITLLKTEHFYGIFSAVNANAIDAVTVYKNAFPSEYGGRTAGVIEMETKTNTTKNQQWHGSVEVNLLTTDANLSIPINSNMSAFVAGRITTQNVGESNFLKVLEADKAATIENFRLTTGSSFSNPPIQSRQPNVKFNDFTAKWLWQPSSWHKVQMTYFQSADNFRLAYEDDFTYSTLRGIASSNLNYDEKNAWTTEGASLQWYANWNKTFKSKLVLSFSNFEEQSELNSILVQSELAKPIIVDNATYNAVNNTAINWKNTWQIAPRQTLDMGYNGVLNRLNLDIDIDKKRSLETAIAGYENSLFSQYHYQSNRNWDLTLGLRATHYNQTEAVYLSPRLQANYQLQEAWQLKLSAGRYYQFLRETYHEDRFGRKLEYYVLTKSPIFPVLSANQVMLGMNYLGKQFEVDVEFYHKDISGITEYAHISPGFDREATEPNRSLAYGIFTGNGRTQGVDLLLRKHTGNHQGWITYTLSKSTNQFPQINNNQPYPAPDDRRHQLKIVNLYDWKRWNFSGTYVFTSGRPYLDISLLDTRDRRTLPFGEFLATLEDYHRVDIGATYQFPIRQTKASIGVSVYNLFNRDNIKYRQFIYTVLETNDNMRLPRSQALGNDVELLDRTLNLSFKWTF